MRNTQHGFTMVELIVVVSIVALLLAIGAPSYRYVTTANRVAGDVNRLVGDLQFARAEAIKEGSPVTVCSSTNGATCSGSATWTTGWIVFADANGNQSVDANEAVLRVQSALTGGDTFAADNAIGAVTFNRVGFALNLPGTVNVSLHDYTNNSSYTRCLNITIVGALSTVKSGMGGCT